MKVAVGYKAEWDFTAEPYGDDKEVWFRVSCGPLSGGVFLSNEQAVSLGNMLIGAAEMASVPVAEESVAV